MLRPASPPLPPSASSLPPQPPGATGAAPFAAADASGRRQHNVVLADEAEVSVLLPSTTPSSSRNPSVRNGGRFGNVATSLAGLSNMLVQRANTQGSQHHQLQHQQQQQQQQQQPQVDLSVGRATAALARGASVTGGTSESLYARFNGEEGSRHRGAAAYQELQNGGGDHHAGGAGALRAAEPFETVNPVLVGSPAPPAHALAKAVSLASSASLGAAGRPYASSPDAHLPPLHTAPDPTLAGAGAGGGAGGAVVVTFDTLHPGPLQQPASPYAPHSFRAWLANFFRKWRGVGDRAPPRDTWEHMAWAWVGAFLSILAIAAVNQYVSPHVELPVLVASFGASAVLLFGTPDSKLAQPRHFLGGHLMSAVCGVVVRDMFWSAGPNLLPLSAAIGMATALLIMLLTRTTHPPGGATALIASSLPVIGPWAGFKFVLTILWACVIMLAVAMVVNNISHRRRYPTYWMGS